MLTELAAWAGALEPLHVALLLLPFAVAAVGLMREKIFATALGALLGFWLLLSGVFTPFLVLAGVGSSLAVLWYARRMQVVDRESVPLDLWRAVFSYWPWLIKEIAKSGWEVARIILHPRLPISPTLVRFRPLQRTNTGLVVHANSITLTPGTITVEASPGSFLVHALTRDGAGGLIDSDMDRRVRRLEGEASEEG